MAYKTVLSVVGMEQGDGDVRWAARLCEQSNGHLSVLVMALATPPPMGDAVAVADAWVHERQSDLAKLASRTSEISALLAATSISGDARSDYPEIGWAAETVGRHARYADLVLIGPELAAVPSLKDRVVEGVLFHSGRPLLLVPTGAEVTLTPKRVVVAWDARLEAARALRESLEMLISADEVRLALVDPVPGERLHGEEPGADAAAFLARHGIKVVIDRLPGEDRPVADVLRRHAGDMAADVLVMGAYGHSRLRERIFGGVTRSTLENPTLPIFMAR